MEECRNTLEEYARQRMDLLADSDVSESIRDFCDSFRDAEQDALLHANAQLEEALLSVHMRHERDVSLKIAELIDTAKQRYNDAALQYNHDIKQLPNRLIVLLFALSHIDEIK